MKKEKRVTNHHMITSSLSCLLFACLPRHRGTLKFCAFGFFLWALLLSEDLYAQGSDWGIVNKSAWAGKSAGTTTIKYQKHYYTAAGEWNGNPLGLWSDGTSLWIAEWRLSKLFAYDLHSFKRDSENDFDDFHVTGNRSARGLWSNGEVMWVSDDFWDILFAYDLVSRERLLGMDVNTLIEAGNESPGGLWSDGEIMWVTDDGDDKIYAYKFGSWEHLPERDINTLKESGNTRLADLWSDGQTIWVAEIGSWTSWGGWTDGKIFAYDLATGARIPSRDIDNETLVTAGVESPNGIWSDGNSIWISDRPDHKVYVFDLNPRLLEATPPPTPARDSTRDFTKLGGKGNVRPTQLWSNGSTLWVADNQNPLVFAYDLATRERTPDQDLSVTLNTGNRILNPAGIWGNENTIWVVDWHTVRVVAFDLQTQERRENLDLVNLADSGNHHPSGMWSDNDTLWVSDTQDARIYAYSLNGGNRRPNSDITGLEAHGNKQPRGLWSDGTTMWVGDWEQEKVYAYDLKTGQRRPNKDIEDLFAAGNLSPSGLWSDGGTLWVADLADSSIYAYPINTEEPSNPSPTPAPRLILIQDPSSPSRWAIEFTGVLKSAPSVEGPFEAIVGARSPYLIDPTQEAQIFIASPE